MLGPTSAGEAVWELHLALAAAGSAGLVVYPADEATVRGIREYTVHDEAGMALDLVLTVASPPLTPELLTKARAAARLDGLAYGLPETQMDAQVDAWLQWSPASGDPPPYTT